MSRPAAGWESFWVKTTAADFINTQLYRDGQGLFPLPLVGPAELQVDRLEKAPDLEVTDHPIFAVFAGERNSFLATVTVNRYFEAKKDWVPPADSSTRVIAHLRNKAPLAVEHPFGAGRVIAVLTKASPAETQLAPGTTGARAIPAMSWPCSSCNRICRPRATQTPAARSARRWPSISTWPGICRKCGLSCRAPRARLLRCRSMPLRRPQVTRRCSTTRWPAGSTRPSSRAPTARNAPSGLPTTSNRRKATCGASIARRLARGLEGVRLRVLRSRRHQRQSTATGRLQPQPEPVGGPDRDPAGRTAFGLRVQLPSGGQGGAR